MDKIDFFKDPDLILSTDYFTFPQDSIFDPPDPPSDPPQDQTPEPQKKKKKTRKGQNAIRTLNRRFKSVGKPRPIQPTTAQD